MEKVIYRYASFQRSLSCYQKGSIKYMTKVSFKGKLTETELTHPVKYISMEPTL